MDEQKAFLSYGGVLKVVRVGGGALNNAALVLVLPSPLRESTTSTTTKKITSMIKLSTGAACNGTWGNGSKVCVIDNLADQTLGVNTTNLENTGFIVGHGVTATLNNVDVPGNGGVVDKL